MIELALSTEEALTLWEILDDCPLAHEKVMRAVKTRLNVLLADLHIGAAQQQPLADPLIVVLDCSVSNLPLKLSPIHLMLYPAEWNNRHHKTKSRRQVSKKVLPCSGANRSTSMIPHVSFLDAMENNGTCPILLAIC